MSSLQIRINSLSEETGCEILGKAEFMNPGGSVKDRAALGLVKWAENTGTCREHATPTLARIYAHHKNRCMRADG